MKKKFKLFSLVLAVVMIGAMVLPVSAVGGSRKSVPEEEVTRTEIICTDECTEHKHDDNAKRLSCIKCGRGVEYIKTYRQYCYVTDTTHCYSDIDEYFCRSCGATTINPIFYGPIDHSFGSWRYWTNVYHIRDCACGKSQYGTHSYVWIPAGWICTVCSHLK